jgi:hypothetical protein
MSRYDQWLTTDTSQDSLNAYSDWLIGEWEKYAEDQHLPIEACEDDHEAHNIYQAWETLLLAVDTYHSHLAEDGWREAEAAAEGEEDTHGYSRSDLLFGGNWE